MNSAKNALLATSLIAIAARQVLVEALSPVEHDRVMRYPDTESAIFELPESTVVTLEKLGAVKRVDVVDTSAVLAASAEASTGPVVTFADAVDMAAVDGQALIDAKVVLGQLDEALVKSDALASELTASQERVLELEALLATKDEEAAALAAAASTADSASTGSADAAADATAAAAAKTTKPAAKTTKRG